MSAFFETYKGQDNQDYFRFHGKSGQILRSEGYTSLASCLGGIQSVKTNAPKDAAYRRSQANDDSYYFVLKAGNHETIAISLFYDTEEEMEAAIREVKTFAPTASLKS